MNSATTNAARHNANWRRLPVEWLERPGASCFSLQPQPRKQFSFMPFRRSERGHQSQRSSCRAGGFTILELLIVLGIIGFMAALALPHLSGFTKGNTLTAATRQLLDDVAFARQRALVNRAQVCMVFLPPNFWTNYTTNSVQPTTQLTNISAHQYCAYALVALRSVGDQPGRPFVHYLTDWKYLPQGVYFSPFLLTNAPNATNYIFTTNTTAGVITTNGPVWPFPVTNFPFPTPVGGTTYSLPYIGFTPTGQLSYGQDQFISLTVGSLFYPTDTNGLPLFTNAPNLVETPPGNATNNPNLIHIDWLTARAKLERNQF